MVRLVFRPTLAGLPLASLWSRGHPTYCLLVSSSLPKLVATRLGVNLFSKPRQFRSRPQSRVRLAAIYLAHSKIFGLFVLFAFGCSTFLGLRHLSPVDTTLVQYLHWVFSRVHCISGRGHCLNHSSHLIGDFPNLEAWTRMQFLRGLISLILLLSHFVIAAQEGQAGSSIGEATVVAIQTRGFFNASSHWCASLGHCYFGQPSQPRHWSFEANQTTSYQDEQFGFQRSLEMRPLPPVDQSYHSVLSKLRRSLDFGCRHDLHPWEGEAEGPSTHELGLGPMDGMEFHRGCEQGFIAEAEKPISKKPQGAKRQRQIYRC